MDSRSQWKRLGSPVLFLIPGYVRDITEPADGDAPHEDSFRHLTSDVEKIRAKARAACSVALMAS